MILDFSSVAGHDLMNDEAYIENVFSDEIVDRLYAAPELRQLSVDMGGHVSVLTCRSVLGACDSDSTKLSKILNWRSKEGLKYCKEIVQECTKQVAASSFVL